MFTRSGPHIPFPTYLLPPSPFRRRKQSTDSTVSVTSAEYSDESADSYLQGNTSHLRCANCSIDICLVSQIISKGFTGRHGRAYLVSPFQLSMGQVSICLKHRTSCLPNTKTDPPSSRQLVTGAHTVSDVRCALCGSMLGWRYDEAEEESQQYKVGKYILETKLICSSSDWENGGITRLSSDSHHNRGNGAIEFDSQDEDECEDLFAGVWNATLAVKRRQRKSFRKISKIESRPLRN